MNQFVVVSRKETPELDEHLEEVLGSESRDATCLIYFFTIIFAFTQTGVTLFTVTDAKP